MITKTKINRVTRVDVHKAADRLSLRGEVPTIAAVRSELEGRGSETTIHNYLKEWKKSKLLAKQELTLVSNNQELQLMAEKLELEQALQKQIAKNEHYAQELINAEKANVAFKEKIYQLEATIQGLNLELTKVTAVNHTLEKLTKEIEQKLAANENDTINKQKLLIDELQQELKNLHAKSMSAIQELSSKGHEALMQEKVSAINLQTKIDSLNKELAESKKQLHGSMLTSQVEIRSLSRQNQQLQKIIQENGLDKALSIDEKLSLSFNITTEEVNHGK